MTKAVVDHSLAWTFRDALGEPGDAVSAAYSRLFWWDLDLTSDIQKGDQIEVIWRPSQDSVVEVLGARFHSQKLGRTLEAWRWQPPGEHFATYWDAEGRGVERRLRGGPISDYEQITALLKDRPSHKGMDFKAPVGTPVMAPAKGLVTRTNWNHANNGNCVEIQLDDGYLVKFLHLSENRIEAGQRVTAGQVVALSGNTGHSTAPHLHYEMHKDGKVVDPLDYHALDQQQLTGTLLVSFQAERARLASL
ncbi:MAG: M23 family metallopeptidase, partial [Oligoflexia bacterium]|nr:M23 family metallopeptidase [Oligoflexia bacterium]